MAAATVALGVRLRGQWAIKVVAIASRLRWRGLALWAVRRIRAEYRIGRGPWKPLARIEAVPTDDGIHVDLVQVD